MNPLLHKATDLYWGTVLLLGGGLFLARNLEYIWFEISLRTHWPVLLILVGISIVIKAATTSTPSDAHRND